MCSSYSILNFVSFTITASKVGEIPTQVQESRLKWYGHVLRREEEYVGMRMMVMEVPWKRRRWMDNIKNDLSERELSGEKASIDIIIIRKIQVGIDAEEEDSKFCNTFRYGAEVGCVEFARVKVCVPKWTVI